MQFDAEQRSAIDVRENVVVSAGAGSGKTRVLTERFVSLLKEGEVGIPEILALTFTRKAAAEMFGRIYERLKAEVPHVRHLAAELERFDEARISTIDSFCAGILRDATTRFGLPSRVVTDDREFTRNARRIALSFTMKHGDDPALAPYIRQYGVDGVIDNLIAPLIMYHIGLARDRTFLDDFEAQERWLRDRKATVTEQIDEIVGRIATLEVSSNSAVAARDGCIEREGDYQRLYEFCNGVKKTFGDKEDAPTLKEAMNLLLNKKPRKGLLLDWYAITNTEKSRETRYRLYELFDVLRLEVLRDRRRSGVLTHGDVMELAVRALTEDRELRQTYRDQFRYIMIDEFQDNNLLQKQLLYLLSDASLTEGVPPAEGLEQQKLFFVGDQKQSIYRFRGADVSVFKGLARDIAHASNDPEIELLTNYRSDPKLIRFFNALFPRVFDDPDTEYEAVFSPLKARSEDDGATAEIVLAYDEPDGDTLPDDANGTAGTDGPATAAEETLAPSGFAEAEWIAQRISGLIHEGGYTPGQIAILLRSSSGQQIVERMLRRRGIPYQTQAIRSLFTEAPANDLYALLQLVFFPDDEEALIAYLRSPFVMLSDDGVVRTLLNRRGGKGVVGEVEGKVEGKGEDKGKDPTRSRAPLDEGRGAPFGSIDRLTSVLERSDAAKVAAAADLYDVVARMVDHVSMSEIVRYLWDEGGYRYAILHRASDHAYGEHYDYLFSLALRYDDRSTIEFVDFLREQLGNAEKIDELEIVTNPNAVQILTVHKSKGLEFPVVFVADCDRGLNSHSEVLWSDPELGVTAKLPTTQPGESPGNVIESHAREDEAARSSAELKRLLYVAATRAEEKLFFSASRKSVKNSVSFFRMVAAAIELNVETGEPAEEFRELLRVEKIPSLSQRDLRNVPIPQGARRRRDDASRLLAEVEVPTFPVREVDTTPSHINQLWRERSSSAPPEESGQLLLGGETDPVEGEEPEDSDATVLGTLTHRLLELQLAGGSARQHGFGEAEPSPPAVPPDVTPSDAAPPLATSQNGRPISEGEWNPRHPEVRPILFGVDDGRERETLCRLSWEMAETFLESEFWAELRDASSPVSVECEVPFLLRTTDPERFFNGKVDLVVEANDEVIVVDFKTDHDAHPDHYEGQIAVYRRATTELYGKPVRSYLFFLRHNSPIEMRTELDAILPEIGAL
jgi:ATP-dependent exoDNAse (exonuclease V) beta subunit